MANSAIWRIVLILMLVSMMGVTAGTAATITGGTLKVEACGADRSFGDECVAEEQPVSAGPVPQSVSIIRTVQKADEGLGTFFEIDVATAEQELLTVRGGFSLTGSATGQEYDLLTFSSASASASVDFGLNSNRMYGLDWRAVQANARIVDASGTDVVSCAANENCQQITDSGLIDLGNRLFELQAGDYQFRVDVATLYEPFGVRSGSYSMELKAVSEPASAATLLLPLIGFRRFAAAKLR